jgi:heat shock protein HslJ
MPKLVSVVSVVVLAAWSLGLSGCSGDGERPPLDGTAWALEGWSISSLYPGDFEITAAFKDGRMSGKAAVNNYFGPYAADPSGVFSVGALASTKMAGPEPAMRAERVYLDLLERAHSYRLDDGRLILFDANGNELLVFTVASRAPS